MDSYGYPRSSFPENWLNQCSHIEASIVSDCPDLTVEKCGLCLVHQHDEVEFKQTIRHGIAVSARYSSTMASLFVNWGFIHHLTIDNGNRNKHNLSMLKDKGKRVLE